MHIKDIYKEILDAIDDNLVVWVKVGPTHDGKHPERCGFVTDVVIEPTYIKMTMVRADTGVAKTYRVGPEYRALLDCTFSGESAEFLPDPVVSLAGLLKFEPMPCAEAIVAFVKFYGTDAVTGVRMNDLLRVIDSEEHPLNWSLWLRNRRMQM